MTEQTQVQLEVSFEGPAVADGRMNVRDLAPSMLGFGALFDSANNVLNGSRASVNVNVRAISSGSFHLIYEVIQAQPMGETLQGLLVTAVQMKELILGTAIGLVFLIKHFRGRKPRVEKINDTLFRLTVDNQTYDVPLELLRLYQDINTRKALSEIVQPVKREGIERFGVYEKKVLIQSVTKTDIEAFESPEFQEPLLDEISRHAFSIISLAFKGDNKWRLTDGEAVYPVLIKDAEFQNRVDKNQESFAKGDILVCDL